MLAWRAKAIVGHNWDRTAQLCYFIPRFSDETVSLEDFNPMKPRKKADEAACERPKNLPQSLTNEEIEAGWRRYQKGLQNEQRH